MGLTSLVGEGGGRRVREGREEFEGCIIQHIQSCVVILPTVFLILRCAAKIIIFCTYMYVYSGIQWLILGGKMIKIV